MSLFDTVVSALGGEGAAIANVEQLASHLGNGGLADIVTKLQASQLGDIVQSWIGTGANLPINADQLISALGEGHISQLTSALGVDSSQLANILPGLIDHLTPNGQLPEGGVGDMLTSALNSGAMKNILGSLLKG